jgi:outer membrane protein TolC
LSPRDRPAPPPPAPDNRPVLNLSLHEAVERAMANNLDIAVANFNPKTSEFTVAELKGFYEPILASTISYNSFDQQAQLTFQANPNKADTTTFDFGISQSLQTGGHISLDFPNNHVDTNNPVATYNPSFNSALNAQLSQPLLRDLKVDSHRYQIQVAKKNHEISDVQFRQTVVNTMANVKNLYYNLVFALDNLDAQRKSLSLATNLVEQNRLKVRVGTLAQLDVIEAESEEASRQESVIVAVAAIAAAEDALRRTIYPNNEPATWASRIVPTDRPTAERVVVDVDAAVRKALADRTDMLVTRKQLENAEYDIAYTQNQRLPGLDLIAAYGMSGLGGTQLKRDPAQGPFGPVIGTVPGNYGDAVSTVFHNDYPTWTVGVNFSYPILNRQANAAHARAQASRDQTRVSILQLEMQITEEVRAAARNVETNYQRIETSRAARILQESRLATENKKFDSGRSTNFLVTQAQRDVALADVAELSAISDYRKSLVEWERVQEAGLSIAGGSGTVSSQ